MIELWPAAVLLQLKQLKGGFYCLVESYFIKHCALKPGVSTLFNDNL